MTDTPTLLSLLGGSYPKDAGTEDEIARRTPLALVRYSDSLDRHAGGRHSSDLGIRLALLRDALAGRPDRSVVVIGRSSGAITATLLASQGAPQIRAIVALGYPFRHPERAAHLGEDPERVAHLGAIRTPTLIFQGRHDEYGSAEDALRYRLSPAIALVSLDCRHEMDLSPRDWEMVVARIDSFARHPWPATAEAAMATP